MEFSDSNRPFHQDAIDMISGCLKKRINLCTSILCVGTYCYLLENKMQLNSTEIKKKLANLETLLKIIPSSNTSLRSAYSSSFTDLEDAILYFTAVENQCDAFITQNTKDFPEPLPIPVLTPAQFLRDESN